MYNDENLEIHFWDWKKYNETYILNFLNYIFLKFNILEIHIDYLDININDQIIDDNIYEKSLSLSKIFRSNNDSLVNIITNKFITRIKFTHKNDIMSYFYVHLCWKNIYYSYDFLVKNLNIPDLFENIRSFYIDLINIFNPLVSNAWFEVLWEDLYRIKKEQFFEWIFGYLSKWSDIDFLKIEKKIILDNGYLFIQSRKINNK